jgi:hypothetical protein
MSCASVLEAFRIYIAIVSFDRVFYQESVNVQCLLGLVWLPVLVYFEIRLTRPNYFCHCRGFFALIKVSVYSLLGQ